MTHNSKLSALGGSSVEKKLQHSIIPEREKNEEKRKMNDSDDIARLELLGTEIETDLPALQLVTGGLCS